MNRDEAGDILVVDDHPDNLDLLAGILRPQGYRVRWANGGKRGIRVAEAHPPDLLLLDIMMPDLNGYDVCRRLKANAETAHLPIIFLSALDDMPDKIKAFQAGGVDYITKPFQAEEVLARVQTHLQIARLRRSLEARNAELERKNRELVASRQEVDHVFSALSEILPGRVLDGKYRLERKIGKGGFGAVYRAMHIGLNRAVAIKIFRPSPVSRKKGDGVVRFRREGISACRVDHPNAVSVLDFGISRSGIAYLVMELLRGRTLGATLKVRHVLSLRRCVEILTPVCSVLMAASAANVLHRDIKPENIFLHRTEAGEVVKVVDFGIAKLMGDDDEPDAAAAVSSDATGMLSEPMHTTGLIGTPVYMAPERLLSEPYDVRADIYSVGVLLYRMISGRIPFTSKKGGFRLMTEICEKGPRPLREVCPSCPPDVAALVMSAMAQSPDDRPTADELAERFQRAVEQLPAELADYVPEGIQPSGEALRELHTMRTQSGDEGSYAITLPSFSLDEAEAGELAQSGGD